MNAETVTKLQRQGRTFADSRDFSFHRLGILGIPVDVLDRRLLTEALQRVLEKKKRGWFGSVNVHAINLAQEMAWFRKFFQDALVCYCDGAGVRLGARLLGKHLPERIALTDWIFDVFALAERGGYGVYLLGAHSEVLNLAVDKIRERFPRLRIAGFHHGYYSYDENYQLCEIINNARPDILVVGMGMPRQERWIAENFDKLNVLVACDAGACFDYIAGVKIRCPRWLGDAGFEWLFRLCLEPRRLWRRYLIGNPLFLYKVLKSKSNAVMG